MYINQSAFARHSCKFRGIIYRNNSAMSIIGRILPNLPFYTKVLDTLDLGVGGLMVTNEFIPGIVKVRVTVALVPAPEPTV